MQSDGSEQGRRQTPQGVCLDACNLGMHIANRLVEVGCTHAFGVPGDFNLLLLDQMLKHPELRMVWCCNELNAGYAADGFARKKGVGCAVVTFCVGGFSIYNAIAGAYAEDQPVILISGGPNSNDFAANHKLHHTTQDEDFGQQRRAFREVTCHQVVIQYIEEAHRLIDEAISEALIRRKPVYIEVCCNLADLTHPNFSTTPVPYVLSYKQTNQMSLQAAVSAAAEVLSSAVKPVLLAGPALRLPSHAAAFMQLADKSGYPVAFLPDAKGMVSEDDPRVMGTYWGAVSSPCVCEIVESADVIITAGAAWTDYSTVGYSSLIKPEKVISVDHMRVTVCNSSTFGCINMADFFRALADKVKFNGTALTNYQRMVVPAAEPALQGRDEPLRVNVLFKHVQKFLTPQHSIITEVGDSWFNTQKLKLPRGCGYEIQLRYGSIGWSVGAVLGYQMAAGQDQRVLALIGDGSFQMTVQEVSTMLRYQQAPIIVLLNNGGYTIEVEIHDGPYNKIKNWDYTGLVKAFWNEEGKLWTTKVRTEPELIEALKEAGSRTDELCFIEVFLHRDDCSRELLEWGSRVSAANARKPSPQ